MAMQARAPAFAHRQSHTSSPRISTYENRICHPSYSLSSADPVPPPSPAVRASHPHAPCSVPSALLKHEQRASTHEHIAPLAQIACVDAVWSRSWDPRAGPEDASGLVRGIPRARRHRPIRREPRSAGPSDRSSCALQAQPHRLRTDGVGRLGVRQRSTHSFARRASACAGARAAWRLWRTFARSGLAEGEHDAHFAAHRTLG